MKKVCLLLFLASVIGCSKTTPFERETSVDNAEITTKSGSLCDDAAKAERFTSEMLESLIKNSSFKGSYTVDTGIKQRSAGSVPRMYVVNFENGGWMIVAGHIRDNNQILAYSETGSFNPSEITNPGVRLWYDIAKSQMESVEIAEDNRPVQHSAPYWIDMTQEYYWARVPLPETTQTVYENKVDSLITTQWGQGKPWNSKTPQPSTSNYSYTGCAAVSCAQILYYLRTGQPGFDIGLYDVDGSYTLSYDGIYYYYIINPVSVKRSNFQLDSPKWNLMAKNKDDSPHKFEPVAELMFDIAERLGMKFYPTMSAVTSVNASIFNSYGVECDESPYDFDLVRQSLDRNQPVEVSCFSAYGPSGHSWVIHGYQISNYRTDRAYQWRLIPPDSLSYYNNLNYDYVFTEEQKQFLHPELVENQVEHNYTYHNDNYLQMNWGWDGKYNSGNYSIDPNWTVNGQKFSREARIIHNFRQ